MNELVWSTGGMVMKVENLVGRKEPGQVPVSPPQIPLERTWDSAHRKNYVLKGFIMWAPYLILL
jgi:hypothetical protein